MGTWDTGPFDNDTAADFASTVDKAAEEEREGIIRDALLRAVNTPGFLDSDDGAPAVAAAALIAAQCPGSEPLSSPYGPKQPLPPLPDSLRTLAVAALDRVATQPSELAGLWADASGAGHWQAQLDRIKRALTTPQDNN